MEQFDKLCEKEDLELLNSENPITLNDRFKLDSYTFKTLVSELGNNFTPNELDEIYLLERNNLIRLINSVYLVLFDTKRLDSIGYLSEAKSIINNEVHDIKIHESVFFSVAIKYLLSNGDPGLNIKFEGTIPKKLFSFRQQTAETWFKEYVVLISQITSLILKKMDKNQALAFILSNTAYYLNKSQTFRYYQQSGETMNKAISRIASELINGKDSSMFDSLNNVPLFKDI